MGALSYTSNYVLINNATYKMLTSLLVFTI